MPVSESRRGMLELRMALTRAYEAQLVEAHRVDDGGTGNKNAHGGFKKTLELSWLPYTFSSVFSALSQSKHVLWTPFI